MSSETVIFTGPSLHPAEAAKLLDATYLPPIKRGDLEPLIASRPRAVGIVDGEFYQSLAVTPKEVLALLEAGVAVYGGASMGALRAVEMEPYGMIGVGSVFRLFRAGVLDADDEVALTYSNETYRRGFRSPGKHALRAAGWGAQRHLEESGGGGNCIGGEAALFPGADQECDRSHSAHGGRLRSAGVACG